MTLQRRLLLKKEQWWRCPNDHDKRHILKQKNILERIFMFYSFSCPLRILCIELLSPMYSLFILKDDYVWAVLVCHGRWRTIKIPPCSNAICAEQGPKWSVPGFFFIGIGSPQFECSILERAVTCCTTNQLTCLKYWSSAYKCFFSSLNYGESVISHLRFLNKGDLYRVVSLDWSIYERAISPDWSIYEYWESA